MEIDQLILRVALTFLVLLALTRIMGRKEISQMTFFNFVSGISIGSIAANLVVSQNLSIQNGILALVGWTAFTLLMDFIDIKSKKARNVITGQPIIVIKDGQVMENEMKKARLDIDSLRSLLREQNVFSMADVQYAIFETNGNLSVMKKDYMQSPTKSDIGVMSDTTKPYSIPTEVISDGKVIEKNLSTLQIDKAWLEQQLAQSGIDDISQVFFAEVQQDGTLYIDKKDDIVH